MTTLEQRIASRSALVAVVGLGYVGFPLAQRAIEAGYPVVGIDTYLTEERRQELDDAGIKVKTGFDSVEQCDIVLICVPTPLVDGEQPDISFITDAAEDITRHLSHEEMLVVLESTSYPGTTREVLLPVLDKAGKRLGQGLYLAYAPERVDPGEGKTGYADIPRIVGGLDEQSGRLAAAFYETLVSEVTLVPTPEVAEMAKLLENIFRAVNIALVRPLTGRR